MDDAKVKTAKSYALVESTLDLIEQTTANWMQQIEESDLEVPKSRFLQVLNFAKQIAKKEVGNDDAFSYAVVDESNPRVAKALLDITHARKKSHSPWLKVVQIRLEPSLDAAGTTFDPRAASKIVGVALVEAFGLTLANHPSKELKVYAEHPIDRGFLEALAANMAPLDGIEVSAHGNWLVLKNAG